jgi:hypothetical protein
VRFIPILLLAVLPLRLAAEERIGELIARGRTEEAIAAYSDVLAADPEASWADRELDGLLQADMSLYAVAADAWLAQLLARPERLDLARRFLSDCIGAWRECPPLYPETRVGRPDMSCADALDAFAGLGPGVHDPRALAGDPRSIMRHLHDRSDRAFAIVGAAYVGAVSRLVTVDPVVAPPTIEDARRIVVLNRLLRCPDANPYDRQLGPLGGESGLTFDRLYHAEMRRDVQDFAWAMLAAETQP